MGSRFRYIWQGILCFLSMISSNRVRDQRKTHKISMNELRVVKIHFSELKLCTTGPWPVRDTVSRHCLVYVYTWQVHYTGETLIDVLTRCAESRLIIIAPLKFKIYAYIYIYIIASIYVYTYTRGHLQISLSLSFSLSLNNKIYKQINLSNFFYYIFKILK